MPAFVVTHVPSFEGSGGSAWPYLSGKYTNVTSITLPDVYPSRAGHTVLVRNSQGPEEATLTKGTLRQASDTVDDAVHPGSRAELQELSDNALLAKVRALPRDNELRATACEIIVDRYQKLVRSCVRQYRGSPEPVEDLMQVGYVGLLKAINNYDPEVGDSLSAYAQPCVSGEIKRHFRDKRWQIHVRRSAQELLLELRKATEELTQELGRTPNEEELAHRLGVSRDDMQEARQADLVFSTYSLDAPLSDREDPALLADVLGEDDPGVSHTIDMESVSTHWEELPEREQRILVMRFYGNLTQTEIGERLGISQMHVSRLLARALGHLKDRLLDPAETGDTHSSTTSAATA
jgi:RNA polymerase sigma-B factor